MEYQLYELLVFFSVYSILGWCLQQCCAALTNRKLSGFCRGPWCMSYGIGAFLVLIGANHLGTDPVCGFILGLSVGIVIEFLSVTIINRLYGGKKTEIKWFEPVLLGMAGVILICHLHPLLTEIIRWMNPWIHFAFLIFFWINYPGDVIESISRLTRHRKENHLKANRIR